MNGLTNVEIASRKYVDERYKDINIAWSGISITPVKGYLTTNVYRLAVNNDLINSIIYIKESSDLENDRFNKYIEDEYINTKYIYDNYPELADVSVVKPLMYFNQYKLFFMEEIEGQRLDSIILRSILFRDNKKLQSVICLCKNWLTGFQSIDPTDICESDKYDFKSNEITKINHIHRRSLQNCKKSEVVLIDRWYKKLSEYSNNIEITADEITLKHNDFAPWNILYDKERITVYDFADIQMDYKYYDLVYFVHSLEKLTSKIPFSRGVLKKMKAQMFKDEGICQYTEKYYAMYFYLQDVALLLGKIKNGGIKSYYYKFKYMTIKNKLIKYLD